MKGLLRAGTLSIGLFFFFPVLAEEPVVPVAKLPCGTPSLLAQSAIRPRAIVPRRIEEGPRALRDSFGNFTQVVVSEHFAFKAGDDVVLDEAIATRLLEGLEFAYLQLVSTMEHTLPIGVDSFFVNVYLGSSGSNAPESFNFAAAYVNLDAEGFPHIVVSPGLFSNYTNPGGAESSDFTTAHELYHVLQFSSNAYALGGVGYWYWEATADWAAVQTYPDSVTVDYFVPAYLMYPHMALSFFDYPDKGTLIELHHYGAQMFPVHLSSEIADWTLIRDSWTLAGPDDDPIEILDELLLQQGHNFVDVFGEFAARNATVDHQRSDNYLFWLENVYLNTYPDEDFRFQEKVGVTGTDGFQRPPQGFLPQQFGYHMIPIELPNEKELTIGFLADRSGTSGSRSSFRLTLVREFSDRIEYEPISFEEDEETYIVEGLQDEIGLFLIVVATPKFAQLGEEFPYEFSIQPGANIGVIPPVVPEEPVEPPEVPGVILGGACAVSPMGNTPLVPVSLFLLFGILIWRRKVL